MTYIHEKNDNKRSVLIYLISLMPLIIYGIYKNGFLLYQNHYISLIEVFKPLILVLISLGISIGLDYIFTKEINYNYDHLIGVIASLFCPVNISYLLFIIVILVILLLNKLFLRKLSINKIALIHLILVLGMALFSNYSYLNIGEAQNIYLYQMMDIIMGRAIGGIASTSIVIGLIVYGLLAFLTNYKKIIPLVCYIGYCLTNMIIMLITKDFNYSILLACMPILGFILVSTDSMSSPYHGKKQIIYALFIGIMTAILNLFWAYEGVFVATLIASLGLILGEKLKFF